MIRTITAWATSLMLAGAFTTATLHAQDPGGKKGKRRPAPPLVSALDANKDGTIDAAELANASTALGDLDANKDGELTRDEIRPKGGRKGSCPKGKKGGPAVEPADE